jgi:hypothetical protein
MYPATWTAGPRAWSGQGRADEDEDFQYESQDSYYGLDDEQSESWRRMSTTTGSISRVTRRRSRSRRESRLLTGDLDAQNGDCSAADTPRHGRLGGIVTTRRPLGHRRSATIGGRSRSAPTKSSVAAVAGRATIVRRPSQRARIVVYHVSRSGFKVTMRQIRL